jgi:LPXTG-site transpeptidase (sortase) family protein
MAAGTSVTLTITVRVDSGATRPSTIVNDAVVDTTQTGLIDSNTVSVSIPAASSSATATPRPAATATPSSGTPGELPETGEQPPQDIRTLWGGFLILGISLMIFVGLAALLILYLRDEAKFIDTFRRKGRWALLGLALAFLMFVVLMNIKPAIEQSAEVQPAPSNVETAGQSPSIESLLGLLPGQLVDQPSATSTNMPETQPPDESVPQATRLIVPVLNLETDLVEARIVNGKWDVSQLAAGVAHLEQTAHPGTKGNAVYAGHVLTKRGIGPFYNLIKMDEGDIIIAEAEGVTYIYEVEWVKVVSPSDIEVASPADTPVITLLTCTKWNGETRKYDSRLAVRARLVDTIRDKLSETGIQ